MLRRKKLWGRHCKVARWLFNYFLKKYRSSHRMCSIKKLFLKTSQYSQDESSYSGKCSVKKRCSWWLIELWIDMFLYWLTSLVKTVHQSKWAVLPSSSHIFSVLNFFWLRTLLRKLRILNCHCWEMPSVLSKL